MTQALIGVDLGVGDELDAEPVLASLAAHLRERGVGPGVWIGTYAVCSPGPRHAAFAVVVPVADGDAIALVADGIRRGLSEHAPVGWWEDPVLASSEWSSEESRAGGAREAIAAHVARDGGRLVAYPGVERLVGEVTAAAVRDTAIEELVNLAGVPVPDDTPVLTRDFVRPRWSGGRLVLHVQPGPRGSVVPFEEPTPHRCCESH